jgi:hypothetical protein
MFVLIESIRYTVVPEGTVEMSFLAGVVLTALALGILLILYTVGKRNLFKKYLLRSDESDKKEILGVINNLEAETDFLCRKTNTTYFKSMANEYHSLVCFLKRRDIP